MSSDPQNPITGENSIPVSLQATTPDAPIPSSTSEQVDSAPVAPEDPTEAESAVPVNNDIPQSTPAEPILDNGSNGNKGVNGETQTAQTPTIEPLVSSRKSWLVKARESIQFRKRKKLEKIMSLFLKQTSITNDEVEKLLHVSDATATRYLSILEKEVKIKQVGRTGQGVSYSRI